MVLDAQAHPRRAPAPASSKRRRALGAASRGTHAHRATPGAPREEPGLGSSAVLRTIDLRGALPDAAALTALLPRAAVAPGTAAAAAAELVDDVRRRGALALAEQADRFDGGRPAEIRVPAATIAAAVEEL